jgi:hypothetical protein
MMRIMARTKREKARRTRLCGAAELEDGRADAVVTTSTVVRSPSSTLGFPDMHQYIERLLQPDRLYTALA